MFLLVFYLKILRGSLEVHDPSHVLKLHRKTDDTAYGRPSVNSGDKQKRAVKTVRF
jgi:hypothetical protein